MTVRAGRSYAVLLGALLLLSASSALASPLHPAVHTAKVLGWFMPASGELGGLNLIWDPQPPLPPPSDSPPPLGGTNLIWDPQPPLPPPPAAPPVLPPSDGNLIWDPQPPLPPPA